MPGGVGIPGTGLGSGQLPATKGTLYSTPGSFVEILSFICFNTAATSETVKIYVNNLGVSRQIAIAVLAQNESLLVVSEGEALQVAPGDYIEGSTTNASSVDYYIGGRAT